MERHEIGRQGGWARGRRLACVCAALLMIATYGLTAVSTGAGAATPLPAPTNLVPDGGTAGPTPTLSWNAVSGADHYQVTYPFRDGSSRTINIWGTRYSPTDDFPTGPVTWSVAAVDNTNAVGTVAHASFTNAAVDAPHLTCPSAIVNFPAEAPTLTWTPGRGIKTYELLVSSSSGFVPDSTDTYRTQATSYTLTKGLPMGQDYYAKVSGTTAAGINSASSATCTFQVVWSKNGTSNLDDATPVYLSPANGASVRNVQLEWSPLKGAARYEVQISPNGNWTNNLLYDVVTDSSVWSPAKALDNGAYYWRVRGIDNQGNFSRWSDYPSTPGSARQFTVTPLSAPTQTAPAPDTPGLRLRDLRFSWNPVDNAGAYQIEISPNSSFSTNVYTCYTTHTDWAPYVALPPRVDGPVVSANLSGCLGDRQSLANTLAGGTVHWHVRALEDLVRTDGPTEELFDDTNRPPRKASVSPWSGSQRFFTNQEAPGLISPASGAIVNVPTMTWSRVDGALFYQVQVNTRPWGWNGSSCTAPNPGGGGTRTYRTSALSMTPTLIPPPRITAHIQCPIEVSWTVTAYSATANPGTTFNYVASPTPAAKAFRWNGYATGGTSGQVVNPIAPSPADGASVTTGDIPRFSWQPLIGADHYEMRWFDSPNITSYTVLQDLNVGGNEKNPSTESFTPNQPLPVGTGAWQVVAVDSGNNVIGEGPKRTLTVNPPNPVDQSTITFSKKASNGVVTTCNSGCTVAATPLISWQGDPKATHYRVYIATDPDFTNLTRVYDTQTNNLRSVEALPDNQAGQSYYVSIQPATADWYTGADATGMIYGPRSAAASFQKQSAGVTNTRTLAPGQTGGACTKTNAGTISDVPTFCWDAAPYVSGDVGAMAYHLQTATTPDFSTILDQVWVDQPTYTPYWWPAAVNGDGGYSPGSVITPPSTQSIRDRTYPDGPLYWRVQALDSTGNLLTYSATASVTKASTGIAMTGPVNGATVDDTPSLTWTSKTFAAQYEVQVAKNGDTNFSSPNVVFAQKTDLTAITPSANNSLVNGTSLPAGDYAWRVRSINAGGQVGTWTDPPRTFTVQPAPPALTSPQNNSTFATTNGLAFAWSPVAGAVNYRIYISTNPTATTNAYINRLTVSTGWSFDRVPVAGKQYWLVQALDGNGQLLRQSGIQSFSYDSTRPSVTNLIAAGGDKRVTLSWTGVPSASNPITSYQVSRYASNTAPTPQETRTTTSTSYGWTGLSVDTTYWFTVTPIDAVGPGTTSTRVNARTNPGNTAVQSFVYATYNDFLGRNPTTPELNAAVLSLGTNPNATKRAAWLDTFAKSATWVNAIVNDFYLKTLGRPADLGGLQYWRSNILSGAYTVAQVAANFYASKEYFEGFGHSSLDTWVRDLYPKLLGRAPDTDGVNYWVSQAYNPSAPYAARVKVALNFYQSQESRKKRVTDLYQKLLHRGPDSDGLVYWAGQILTKGDIALATSLASSTEYYTSAHDRFPG